MAVARARASWSMRERRAESVDLELGPRPGDEHPHPQPLGILSGLLAERLQCTAEPVGGSVEAAHLVVVPSLGEQGLGHVGWTLDGLLLQLDRRRDDGRRRHVSAAADDEVDETALDAR